MLGLGLLGILVWWVDFGELEAIIRRSRPGWLIFSGVMTFVTLDLQVLLFGYVASPFARIPHRKLLAYTLIGRFFSLFLPSSVGGDVIKAMYLTPYFRNRSMAYAAVAVQRALGGLSTLLVAIVAWWIFVRDSALEPETLVKIITMVGLGLAAGFWVYKYWGASAYSAIISLRRMPGGRHVVKFVTGVSAYGREPGVIAVTFFLSILTNLAAAGMFVLLAHTLDIELAFGKALLIASATMLAVIIPITPGGVGVNESAFILTAVSIGVDKEEAFAIAILGRLLGYICSIPGGFLYVLLKNRYHA